MKKIIILIIILLFIGGGVGGYFYWQAQKEDRLLSSNLNIKDAYETVKKRKREIREDSSNYNAYMSLAFNWKSIGEELKEDKYLWKSVKVYDEVIKRWGLKAYLPFLNQANVYILLGEYEKAEEDLKVTLEIDPGEQNLYIALAELYQKYLYKSDEEIRAVYIKGLQTLIGGGNLVVNYASYLNEIGDYEEAIKFYESLAKAYPQNTNYSIMVGELEQKIANK